jgi:hypothetical protein
LLSTIATYSGIKPADLIALTISALAAVGTFAAAVAAWRAAQATRESVAEMREMRHQSVRPAMDVQVPAEIILSWGIGVPVKLTVDRSLDKGELPFVRITNVGFGAALDLEAALSSHADVAFNAQDDERLERFFAESGMRFLRRTSAEGYVVWPSERSEGDLHPFLGWVGSVPHGRASVCDPGSELKIKLHPNSFQAALLDVIRGKLAAEIGQESYSVAQNAHRFEDVLILKYRSHSGESFEQRVRLRIEPSFLYQLPFAPTSSKSPLRRDWHIMQLRFDLQVVPDQPQKR